MIDTLRSINRDLMNRYDKNPRKLEHQLMIANFLKYNDCFFRITIEDAFKILKELEISNCEETYITLVSFDNYN